MFLYPRAAPHFAEYFKGTNYVLFEQALHMIHFQQFLQ